MCLIILMFVNRKEYSLTYFDNQKQINTISENLIFVDDITWYMYRVIRRESNI